MGDLVDETLRGIRERMKELAPAVAEYRRLEAAYAALDGSGGRRDTGADTARRQRGRGGRPRAGSAGGRAKRGANKAAVFAVIEQRPGVTVAELASVTGIAKPLIYNTTRTGVERGELERVALPGGPRGFKLAQQAPTSN
jgi:hypothetical protein